MDCLRLLSQSFALVTLAAIATKPGAAEDAMAERAPTRRALIIAIDDYPRANGYSKLNSYNDVPLVSAALDRQGFVDVRKAINADATRDGILGALKALEEAAAAGDVLVVHFSGHGHQITDDNGDEIDGYDELLVPYDAPANWDAAASGSYKGEKHIRDDEIGEIFTRLRRKVGPQGEVLFTVDACFSGSVTRGPGDSPLPTRGAERPLGQPAETRSQVRELGGGVLETPATPGTRGGGASDADLGRFVVITGSRHNEKTHEIYNPHKPGQIVGPLSLTLGEVLSDIAPQTTYATIFDRVRRRMAQLVPQQEPTIEGSIDRQVFSGVTVAQKPYFAVDSVRTERLVRVAGGSLVGLLPGSEVEFHSDDAAEPSPETLLAKGVVRNAGTLSADVELTTPAAGRDLTASRAFVTRYALGDAGVRVQLAGTLDSGRMAAIRRALADAGEGSGIVVTDEAPDLIVSEIQSKESGSARQVVIWPVSGEAPIQALDAGEARLAESVRDRIASFARSRYLKTVSLSDPSGGLKLAVELVPAKHTYVTELGESYCSRSQPMEAKAQGPGARILMRPGDGYVLRVHNRGKESAYVTVLDFMADGQVSQLYPDPGQKDNVLSPGDSYTIDCIEVTEPYGAEVLKVFATRAWVDFEPLTQPGARTRGAGDAERLKAVFETGSALTRSGRNRAPSSVATEDLILNVVREAPTGGGQ